MSGRVGRREKKKRSKPTIFAKDSKKRSRSDSTPPCDNRKQPAEDIQPTEKKEEISEESASSLQKKPNTWKSLPRPSKITNTQPQSTVPREDSPAAAPVRRSLSIGECTELNKNKGEHLKDTSPSENPTKSIHDVKYRKRSSSGTDTLSNNPQYHRDFNQYEEIASTSTGSIYRVESKVDNKFFAIKKISFPHFDESQASYDELLHEVYTLSQLSHPNIVKYYHSWIEFEKRQNSLENTEETHHSFLIQLPSTPLNHAQRTSSNLDDTSLSESIDSSITAITFTEYALTSDNENFDDDPTDEATDDFTQDNFPFGEDTQTNGPLLSRDKVTLYIQMELCTTTMQDYLNQRTFVNEKHSLSIFTQLLLGVKYLHERNLMHRDLHPTNIFIFHNAKSDSSIVKIGDFSVSTDQVPYLFSHKNKSAGETEYHDEDELNSEIIGDYSYASPELRRGAQCFQSTDIFSLGVILFELFYNCAPNHDKHLKELRRRVLPAEFLINHSNIASMILWLMSPDPSERPTASKILECKLFEERKLLEHVVIPKKDLEDLDKKLQNQESTIHEQESIIKQQEQRIAELMRKENQRNSSSDS